MENMSIVIPAYNEEGSVYNSLLRLKKSLKSMKINHEVVVVNDGSTDNTLREAERAARKFGNIKIVGYKKNRGKGYAIKFGIKNSSKQLVTFLDADRDLNPKQIRVFMDYMEEKDADVVVGSKRHPLTRIRYPIGRRIFSRFYNIMVRWLFNLKISDTQSGIKIYKRHVLKKILPHLLVRRFAIDVEMLSYANYFGYKIVEAPIVLDFSKGSWGKIGLKDIYKIFIDTMAVARRFHTLQTYATIVRDTGIGLLLFGSGLGIYKQFFNPHTLPLIGDRIFYALVGIGILLIVLSIPYEKIAKRMK